MAVEIERKYLVHEAQLPALPAGTEILQGYLPTTNGTTVRVRIAGNQACMTIKMRTSALSRREHEFPIPMEDAREILADMCFALTVEKVRYNILYRGQNWELDIFKGANHGLVMAELELQSEDQAIELPPWVGTEVTSDERYSNSSLALYPYTKW